MKTLLATLAAGLALATCGSAAADATPLTDTGWQLVSIDSVDGPTSIEDPSTFTVTFGADGHAAFLLDCNRGSGSWQATAVTPDSGALWFGPIAVTLMMCPQPSLDTRVAAALSGVGAWHIEDGQLFMTPASDTTTLRWTALPDSP
ncbi:MAG TPA: META domain-containing protein [Mycobacterium sp.]